MTISHPTDITTSSMAALLPTILSDDDEVELDNRDVGGSKKRARNKKESKEAPSDTENEDDGGSINDEMDGDFEFGGLLVSF